MARRCEVYLTASSNHCHCDWVTCKVSVRCFMRPPCNVEFQLGSGPLRFTVTIVSGHRHVDLDKLFRSSPHAQDCYKRFPRDHMSWPLVPLHWLIPVMAADERNRGISDSRRNMSKNIFVCAAMLLEQKVEASRGETLWDELDLVRIQQLADARGYCKHHSPPIRLLSSNAAQTRAA